MRPRDVRFVKELRYEKRAAYLPMPPTKQGLTQGQWSEGRLKWWIRGGEGRARAEVRSPAGLCCSSTHLEQCDPDEPSCPKESIIQLTHPKVAQPILGVLRLQVCHCFLFRATLLLWKTPRLFAHAPNQTRFNTRSMIRRPIIVGIRGEQGRKRTEARTLLICVVHRPTSYNVSLIRHAGSWTQIWVQTGMPANRLS